MESQYTNKPSWRKYPHRNNPTWKRNEPFCSTRGAFVCTLYRRSFTVFYGNLTPPISRNTNNVRPCSHCQSCAGTVPICRISGVCERAMSAIKLDLISENLICSREGSVFRHNYLCRNKCNANTDYTCVGERWRCRLDIINFVIVNYSQSIYL